MWFNVTAGRGPGECQIAVSHVVDHLIAEAVDLGLAAQLLESEPTPYGLASALVSVPEAPDIFAASWEGTVRWTCPSSIRPHWKRKNWFVRVDSLRPPDGAAACDPRDLRIETRRASGPGGQHVNTTESAVRIIHLPTGLVAQASEERSQHRNRALAMARLYRLLANQQREAEQAVRHARWETHDDLERGNPIRIYDGPEFKRRS